MEPQLQKRHYAETWYAGYSKTTTKTKTAKNSPTLQEASENVKSASNFSPLAPPQPPIYAAVKVTATAAAAMAIVAACSAAATAVAAAARLSLLWV